MSRYRVDEEYESKKKEILDAAAKLFARVGYANAKMADIAAKCGASKSMLYHYFPKKEDVLFEMLKEHMQTVLTSLELAVTNCPGPAVDKFVALVVEYIHKSARVRTRHVVAMYDVKFLPKPQRVKILDLERRLVEFVAECLKAINPELPSATCKPYALFVFGILNWTDIWYDPKGKIAPAELADRISTLFLHGFLDTHH